MSSEASYSDMVEEPASEENAFGELNSYHRNTFGTASAGARGGGFHWLLDQSDEERGFFSERDRRLLLTANWDDKLADSTERNARMRIRTRVIRTFFDSRYLRYITDTDRDIIFQNLRDAGYDLHFREGFKEFIRFTYLGLSELETEIDIDEIIETAIEEARNQEALDSARNLNHEVDIEVNTEQGDSVEELERRHHQREFLSHRKLAILVNSDHTNKSDDIPDASDIDLTDAIYYDARQPDRDRYGYSWEDPDREEAEEIVEFLRSVFEEYDVESYSDLKMAVPRIQTVNEDLGDELTKALNHLSRVAPNFETQLAAKADLTESDMNLLHAILWNPDNIDVETALEENARPPTAGEDWDRTSDENLQRFIARVEVERELGTVFTSGGEQGASRWEKVLELADFDPDEWEDYLHKKRVEAAKKQIRGVFSEVDEKDFELPDNRNEDGTLKEEFIDKIQQESPLSREEIVEEFGVYEPIENVPGRKDLPGVETYDDFLERFGKTHDAGEIAYLESNVGEQALADAFRELSTEWEDSETKAP